MLTAEQINSIHRLHWSEHWSVRKIARHLHLGRRTISQYLVTPARSAARRQRASKLDPFKATIAELLEQDAKASAMVIAQRLRPLGFDGGLSILKDYLHAVRAQTTAQRAYVRMEPGPGERFEIDWGHFGALLYRGTRASCMPSAWWNVTAANCLWSLLTVRVSRPSCAVTSTLSSSWAGSHGNSGMTISPPLSPNMMAT
jgi:predicted transcriptional regulator